jgi:trehalose monomycolate/heme transporter
VVRMFLVPAVMKLLGDDCWWAPRWMKRLQERLGLGETELPDERKRPAVREPSESPEALVGAGGPAPRTRPRPPHDPTHPAAEGSSRPGATTRIATPPRTNAPSGAGTTRIPTARTQSDEPQTTRLSMAKNAVRNVVNNATALVNHPPAGDTQRTRPAPPPHAAPPEEREIESWLGELRGTAPTAGQPAPLPSQAGGPPARPSADATRAMPDVGGSAARGGSQRQPRPQSGNEPTTAMPALGTPPDGRGRPRPQNADATTAIPTQRKPDADAATEKLNTGEEEEPKRRGGGVSAQDLLRREGRI